MCAVKTKIMTLFNNFFCFVSVDERSQEKSTATSVRTCVAIYGALRFDQNVLICVPKMNEGLMGLEQHEGE